MRRALRIPIACTLTLLLGSLPALSSSSDPAEEDAFFDDWMRMDDLDDTGIPHPDEWMVPGLEDFLHPLPIWDVESKLSAGGGYRDNVMLSSFQPEGGGFLFTGFETMLLRIGAGTQFSVVFDAEHLEFLSGDLPNDTFVAASTLLTIPVRDEWTATLPLHAFHLNQVIDATTLDSPGRRIRVRGYGISFNPSIRRRLPHSFFVDAGAVTSRQIFRAPLDDYWEFGPKLTAGWTAPRSEVSLSLEFLRRDYDNRHAISPEGEPLPETNLEFRILRPEIAIRHTFDEARRWRSVSRFGFETLRDNETDYFAYDRLRASQQIIFDNKNWAIEGMLQYVRYDYLVQRISFTGPRRTRQSWGTELEARRILTDQFELFGRYEWEDVDSNDPEGNYHVNTWIIGLGWKF